MKDTEPSLLESFWTKEVLQHDNYTVVPNLLLNANSYLADSDKLAAIDLLLLTYLASYRRKENAQIFPAQERIGNALNVSKGTIRTAIRRLMEHGWLKKVPRGRGWSYSIEPTIKKLLVLAEQHPPIKKHKHRRSTPPA